jgi:MoaA/NifB/PqqE/SkfB family radical SAM enzyme
MMLQNQTYVASEILKKLDSRPVAIWGARMTGLGFARFFKRKLNNDVVAFIDSDPALHKKNINGVLVYSPEELSELMVSNPNLMVVIAVAIKEDEIIVQLNKLGFYEKDYISYSSYCTEFYTIDVVGTCNLKCPSCPHGSSELESPLGVMEFNTFEKVIAKAMAETDIVSHVSLYSWGEPLLNPNLGKMIKHLHNNGIAVAISSNLSIKFEKSIEKMIKESPDYLKISLSGYYPEVYDATHTGGNINLVKSNMYRLKYLIDKYSASTLVDVNYHLYNNNCNENKIKMKQLCDELGFSLSATYSLVMPLERVIEHCEGKKNTEVESLEKLLLVSIDEGIAASAGVELSGCPFRENQININWDLNVPVCCTVFTRNKDVTVSQNYLQTPLKEINNSKGNVNLCKKCEHYGLPSYNMGFNREKWEKIAMTKKVSDY